MIAIHRSRAYENFAPFIARIIFGAQFLIGAAFKVMMFSMMVEQAAAVGVPFPMIAVCLAFVLEVATGLMLIFGFHTRLAAFLLAGYVVILIAFFYRNVGDPAVFPQFMTHISLLAALVYVSVYGARSLAVRKDQQP